MYIPRIIWLIFEEGKIFAMVKGVKPGAIMKKNEKDKITSLDTVANNVVDYIMMPEGGHFRYGMGYMFSQVCNITMIIVVNRNSTNLYNRSQPT